MDMRRLRKMFKEMARELLLCVVLPSMALLAWDAVAQDMPHGTQPQSQTQPTSDPQIAAEINSKMMQSKRLRPLDLGVWVHDGGIVTMSGTVPNNSMQRQAEALVRSVNGVRSLDDKISVSTSSAEAKPASPAATPNPVSVPQPTLPLAQPQQQTQASLPKTASQSTPTIAAPPAQIPPPDASPSNPTERRSPQMQSDQPKMTIANGTRLWVQILQTLDSHHSRPGRNFDGVLAQSVFVNGLVALPRGAQVEGTIIDARPPGHLKGKPLLALQLSSVNIGQASYMLTTLAWMHEGPGKGGQTAGNAVGGAAFGTFAGAVVGGGPAALLGAAIGGLSGLGLSALSPSAHIFVPAESVLSFRLTAPLIVREPTANEVQNAQENAPPVRDPRDRRRTFGHRPPYAQPGPSSLPPSGPFVDDPPE